jgi:flagellar biosynthetic protein FliQ
VDVSTATDLARQAVMLAVLLAAPVLLAGLIVGTIVSLFQAATQIHEQTLSLLPRMAVMVLTAVLLGPWIVGRLVEFAAEMFSAGP